MEYSDFAVSLATTALLLISWDLRSIKEGMKERQGKIARRKVAEPPHGHRDKGPEITQPVPKVAQRDPRRD